MRDLSQGVKPSRSAALLSVACALLAVATWAFPKLIENGFSGAVIWITAALAVAAGASRLAAGRLPEEGPLLRAAAAGLLAQVVAATTVAYWGLAGRLGLPALLATAAVVSGFAARIAAPAVSERSLFLGRLEMAALGVAALAVAYESAALLLYFPIDSDNMWYHYPMIGEWARTGSIRPAETIPLIARAYPGFREAFMTFLTLPVGHEHLAIPGLLELPLFGLVLYCLVRTVGGAPALALGAAAYALTTPQVAGAGHGNDLALGLHLVTALLFLLRFQQRPSCGDALLAGVALGALAATKYSGLIYAGLLSGLALVQHLLVTPAEGRRAWRAIGLAVVAAAVVVRPQHRRLRQSPLP